MAGGSIEWDGIGMIVVGLLASATSFLLGAWENSSNKATLLR